MWICAERCHDKEIKFPFTSFSGTNLFACLRGRGKPNLLDMGSLMIKPIQRVMKYPLLLCELLNSTPMSHPDHKALQEALAAIKDMNMNINELKRRKDLGQRERESSLFFCFKWYCCNAVWGVGHRGTMCLAQNHAQPKSREVFQALLFLQGPIPSSLWQFIL